MLSGPHVRVRSLDAAVEISDDLIGHIGDLIVDKEVAKRQKPFVKKMMLDEATHLADAAAFDLRDNNCSIY